LQANFIYYKLTSNITFKIYQSTKDFSKDFSQFSCSNVFLSLPYFKALESSKPCNMEVHFILFSIDSNIVGIAMAQYLNISKLESFGERNSCIKTKMRNLTFKSLAQHVLFIGNNMLTGQNSFYFKEGILEEDQHFALKEATIYLQNYYKSKKKSIHITALKDFDIDKIERLKKSFSKYYQFSIQPEMVFEIDKNWNAEEDYVNALTKKYRDQYKRARKKCSDIVKQKLELEDIQKHNHTMYEMYHHVALNASFNTFFLCENHFLALKKELGETISFYGYFYNDVLIGFNTLIKNGEVMDTYFLGYDAAIQKEKMLYINMLYDMVAYSIVKKYSFVNFGRTALEIKSSIGAKSKDLYGLFFHKNSLLQKNIHRVFNFLEPKVTWNERSPFKV
jgi:hypothetical protein